MIAKAKLQGIALQFVQGRESLSSDACSYAELREHLVARFTEKLPAQYHYTKLQDATQEKGESVEKFADRCRRLSKNYTARRGLSYTKSYKSRETVVCPVH